MITLDTKESLYLRASGRVRGLENSLLTQDKLTRLIDAEDISAAYRVVSECGYVPPQGAVLEGTQGIYSLSSMLSRAAEELYDLCEDLSESRELTDFFRARIDAHNIKVVLKSALSGRSPEANMLPGGVFPASEVKEALEGGKPEVLGNTWAEAAAQAREILLTVADGQRCDFVIDNAMLSVMASNAEKSGSGFLSDYARFCADKANVKVAVRLSGAANAAELAEDALNDLGNVSKADVLKAVKSGEMDCFAKTVFAGAVSEGLRAKAAGDTLTGFEKLLDKADGDFFADVKYLGMGAPILINYIRKRETEQTVIRKVISAKLSGADRAEIERRIGA
ncbi:MAG: V0D/AC39 family V-type ATPase subunit [Eubacteriales bacterium]